MWCLGRLICGRHVAVADVGIPAISSSALLAFRGLVLASETAKEPDFGSIPIAPTPIR
jgi:hypothetical protein